MPCHDTPWIVLILTECLITALSFHFAGSWHPLHESAPDAMSVTRRCVLIWMRSSINTNEARNPKLETRNTDAADWDYTCSWA